MNPFIFSPIVSGISLLMFIKDHKNVIKLRGNLLHIIRRYAHQRKLILTSLGNICLHLPYQVITLSLSSSAKKNSVMNIVYRIRLLLLLFFLGKKMINVDRLKRLTFILNVWRKLFYIFFWFFLLLLLLLELPQNFCSQLNFHNTWAWFLCFLSNIHTYIELKQCSASEWRVNKSCW